MPVTFSIESFLDGSKTAMLTVSVPADRYQLDPNDQWLPVHNLKHGDQVQAVNHFGRHFSRVGEVTPIRSLKTNSQIAMMITAITFVSVAQLDDQTISSLGYKTREDWLNEWGDPLHQRHAWLIQVIPASDALPG